INEVRTHMWYTKERKIWLPDGPALTARRVGGRLSESGQGVGVLSPEWLCLCRLTRHVRRVHRVPSYGPDPLGWVDAALAVYLRGGFDLLFPPQEQVAVLSHAAGRLAGAGIRTPGPPLQRLPPVHPPISPSA